MLRFQIILIRAECLREDVSQVLKYISRFLKIIAFYKYFQFKIILKLKVYYLNCFGSFSCILWFLYDILQFVIHVVIQKIERHGVRFDESIPTKSKIYEGGGVLLTCLGNLLWEYYSTGKKRFMVRCQYH